MYPKGVVEIAKKLKPSKRGEYEITDLNKQLDCTLVLLDRGYAWFDTGTFDSFYDATSYVMSIQKRQGLQIACPEEIAYNNGWITKEDIEKSIKELGSNSYKEYLEKLIK
jgi:glucose-1-phosphate thymidylyltransferase